MKKLSLLSILAIFLSACSIIQKNTNTIELEEIVVESPQITERAYYHESPKRINDLLHTQLEVSFDWNKQHLLGKAHLTLKPYFNPQKLVVLDAKGFDIHEISLVNKDGTTSPLSYEYDSLQLFINLNRTYTREENFTLFIDYTAKPNELNTKGSRAITGAKGLYFINPKGTENKPMQIWTQGEPESNSCWFPCIDKPNERCTQEIAITVEDKYTTLSNGLKISSTLNNDGTRTDIWKQELEHAPYLFMMAIGEFHKTEDQWRDIDVNYYVEPKEAKHAQRIFGKTPQMMEFYSKLLGFDYPWEKYSQVIVRDYVSGAMENTTAVIHGEFVYSDEREYIDDPNEMIIAHELFHHWFGDWVTCESWPNLPLNEAFATYGEYLWMEGAYSPDEAAHYLHGDLKQYLNESRRKQVDLIRFDNENPGNMFDSHSYAKGGRILHMLRYSIGDDAFFKGLEHYLTEYANQAVEVHHLRLAMEKVSGEDLNWFFNQWFLASGHALINVEQEIKDNEVILTISQNQSLETTPLYKIPVAIDVYVRGETIRKHITLTKQKETFQTPTSQKADLVVFDPDHYLLAEVSYDKSDEQWIYQLENAPHYFDRIEALDSLVASTNFVNKSRAVKIGLSDSFWAINTQALKHFKDVDPKTISTSEAGLINLAQSHPKSDVRAAAINNLSIVFDQDENVPSRSHTNLYKKLCFDDSYIVAGDALIALSKVELNEAYTIAKKELETAKKELKSAIYNVIALKANLEDANLMAEAFKEAQGFDLVDATHHYLLFLQKQSEANYKEPLHAIYNKCKSIGLWYERYYVLNLFNSLIESSEGTFKNELHEYFKMLVEQEEDERVLKYLGLQN